MFKRELRVVLLFRNSCIVMLSYLIPLLLLIIAIHTIHAIVWLLLRKKTWLQSYFQVVNFYLFIFSDDRGMLELMRTTDYGKTFKTVATKIFSFGLGGRFLFASVMTGKVSKYLQYQNQIIFYLETADLSRWFQIR